MLWMPPLLHLLLVGLSPPAVNGCLFVNNSPKRNPTRALPSTLVTRRNEIGGNLSASQRHKAMTTAVPASSSPWGPRFITEIYDRRLRNDERNENQNDEDDDWEVQLDNLLDSPIFDPQATLEDEKALFPLRWFAQLVQQDYFTAEALYTSVIFALMVIVGQELVRIQLYGDAYVPFSRGNF